MLRRPSTPRSAVWIAAALLAACFTADQPTAIRWPSESARRDVGPGTPSVVISQIYGGGGNSGAPLKNDFIELFNPGSSAVDLTGWSVQYASATGTTWQVTTLSGTIQPGTYYLVQEAAGTGVAAALPTPDATGSIPMSASAGKVVLAQQTTAFVSGTSCPSGATVIDEVGFGGTADCQGTTANLSNTTAAVRKGGGCVFTAVTSSDFDVIAPNPRNSASATNTCSTAGAPVTVTVAPASPSVIVGLTQAFTATALDASSNVVGTTFTWKSSDNTIASVDGNGVATGVAPGTATITATSTNNVAGTATLTVNPVPTGGSVVISQIYGGGGNSGATFTNDYVELFNPGTTAADITGYAIQYSSATGTTWGGNTVTLPSATVQPGHYYLVQLASNAAVGAALPTPDAAFTTINMSGTTGKVILVRPGVTPSVSCPTGVGIVDFVEYGSSANCTCTYGGST